LTQIYADFLPLRAQSGTEIKRGFYHEKHEVHEGGFGGSSTLADKSFGLCSKQVFVPAQKAFSLQAIACPKPQRNDTAFEGIFVAAHSHPPADASEVAKNGEKAKRKWGLKKREKGYNMGKRCAVNH
jgi:hypothetical protein